MEEDSEKCMEYWGARSDNHGKLRHMDSMVDNGGSREALGTDHAVLAAFPNLTLTLTPKMHKAFHPREVLISKE